MALLKGEPLVTKLAALAKYAVLPGSMFAALFYSPSDYWFAYKGLEKPPESS
ncbi:hypothetical protein COLO4_07461 [Corchorus olitorius]|uniref:Uncharacterized protein n=1 Tax=Corchorus olitorius TaxID=93759 RepID=A0A1R3KJY6_9ROSI|nr:hypothetical protein COLO4_07461 [Corchorus olitorius]